MKKNRIIVTLLFLSGLTGCQTLNTYECAMGGCATVNAQKRAVLTTKQQRNEQLSTEHKNIQKQKHQVRTELTSVQKDYQSLSDTIASLQEDLRKAGMQTSGPATELSELQRDINLRQSTSASSTKEIQKQELAKLRKREKNLREQIKILLTQ